MTNKTLSILIQMYVKIAILTVTNQIRSKMIEHVKANLIYIDIKLNMDTQNARVGLKNVPREHDRPV